MTPEARRYASRFAALGHEVRLEIIRRLIETHPKGMVAGEIQQELNIPPSTLSHHLDALLQEKLIQQHREGRFLRYLADTESLREILEFLYAECCTRNEVLRISVPGRKASS
ncbi:MAG TPA: metalloregulator ArsR/SmtB family transcription factor [Thermoanaerobaculia bacterium]|jgi:DNA-binding transcriptional ArsR family regulator|nr:metalloregulator ArsR/SmtB family transcription factor [Thermoanaerobaculia bacterium]